MDCKKIRKAKNTVKINLVKQKTLLKINLVKQKKAGKSKKKQEKTSYAMIRKEASIALKTFFPCSFLKCTMTPSSPGSTSGKRPTLPSVMWPPTVTRSMTTTTPTSLPRRPATCGSGGRPSRARQPQESQSPRNRATTTLNYPQQSPPQLQTISQSQMKVRGF